ncbi:Na+/H+ antiporter NhaA [Novosphingobium sp. MMS21-SN21R]|uniref:Na+/H+ antiporter NhaA n=1 Tax=Novosphingobium sp. MMS21-SN21R TaxID=2969298 RepID=UPI002885CFA4|nr:Na+/H+ antiporter NhaA [Novosphingobium sp. MMS21-SN21R]MDT0508969.1 Na+/H+ antiporter NhaA [Novosphingobium sp. MMS21-SN21R]
MVETPGLKTMWRKLSHNEAAPGLVLMACAAIALLIANSPLQQAWHDLFHSSLAWTPVAKLDSAHLWINDGLMAVFFFVVGLEIKREVLAGELSDARRRRLPIIAALAGMAVPALVYLAFTRGDPALQSGWAIPSATDIAFAIGVLALAGKGLPPSLRLFLLTVAIVDDLGAVMVIAFFYTSGIKLAWLGASAAILGLLVLANRFGVRSIWPYVLGAIALWFTVLHSGVHATIAGVLAALTVPLALNRQHDSPLLRLEHALVSPNGFLIVPLFGLANAGVHLGLPDGGSLALPLGIGAGLVLGKQVGILGSILLAERFGIARRPEGASVRQLWGIALLCGIGFTMSLFIAGLAFPSDPLLVEEAKLGILGGSAVSAIAGLLLLQQRRSPAY